MPNPHLSTYLNNHLAGSVGAMELLEYLASVYAGTPTEPLARALLKEVAEDREELEQLMARLGIGQSTTRKASAWIAEKLAELKLKLDEPAAGPFRLMEGMEAVSLGIEGKRSLWRALESASQRTPELRRHDWNRLIRRAEDQRQRAEQARLDAAKSALGGSAE